MSFHRSLTPERWRTFELPQQLIMIANEVHRARLALTDGFTDSARSAYLRALDLTELTIEVADRSRSSLLRELLRWRELLAFETIRPDAHVDSNGQLLEAVLLLHPESAKQRPYVLGG